MPWSLGLWATSNGRIFIVFNFWWGPLSYDIGIIVQNGAQVLIGSFFLSSRWLINFRSSSGQIATDSSATVTLPGTKPTHISILVLRGSRGPWSICVHLIGVGYHRLGKLALPFLNHIKGKLGPYVLDIFIDSVNKLLWLLLDLWVLIVWLQVHVRLIIDTYRPILEVVLILVVILISYVSWLIRRLDVWMLNLQGWGREPVLVLSFKHSLVVRLTRQERAINLVINVVLKVRQANILNKLLIGGHLTLHLKVSWQNLAANMRLFRLVIRATSWVVQRGLVSLHKADLYVKKVESVPTTRQILVALDLVGNLRVRVHWVFWLDVDVHRVRATPVRVVRSVFVLKELLRVKLFVDKSYGMGRGVVVYLLLFFFYLLSSYLLLLEIIRYFLD